MFRDWLFVGTELSESLAQRHAQFQELMAIQIEVLEFEDRSMDAFCWDDAVRFVRRGGRLEIEVTDRAARAAWERDTRKLWQLHDYWMGRAIEAFAHSDMVHQRIGRPENEDDNRVAWIKALAARMRLSEVYGVADKIYLETGSSVDLFQTLLAQELTTKFYLKDYIAVFASNIQACGHWRPALSRLALGGLLGGLQNRLPFTWSNREAKIGRIVGWTVTPAQPNGSAAAAQAILDFWCYDMEALAERLRRGEPGLEPRFFERPVLRFGGAYVQFPWVSAFQSNGHAAINNLRRLGARRTESRNETRRIEANLGRALRDRGFRVLINWEPSKEYRESGEVDVVAARDGHLFIFEIKSTFVRETVRDSWLHLNNAVRKAGRQLVRKRETVAAALKVDAELKGALGLETPPLSERIHSWIVDTSIEGDHRFFSGCLKLSLEEMLIALWDDRQHLRDGNLGIAYPRAVPQSAGTLYPTGFDAARFVDVIQSEAVWH